MKTPTHITRQQAKEQGLSRFFEGTSCRNGHIAEKYVRNGSCVVCKAETEKRWYASHQEQVLSFRTKLRASPKHKQYSDQYHKVYRQKNREQLRHKNRQWYKENGQEYNALYRSQPKVKISMLLSRAKSRAKQRNVPFDITKEDIIIPEKCPVLHIPIVTDKTQHDNLPSLDCIVPSLGYVRGNVCVISMRANRLKNESTLQELEALVEYVRQHSQQIPHER